MKTYTPNELDVLRQCAGDNIAIERYGQYYNHENAARNYKVIEQRLNSYILANVDPVWLLNHTIEKIQAIREAVKTLT